MLESDKCLEEKKEQSKGDGVCDVFVQWVGTGHNFKLSAEGRTKCKGNI